MSRFRFLIFVFLIFVTSALYCADIVEEVVWESPLAYSDFARLVKIKEGEALSIKKIRRTVKLLYASKKFEKIDVSSEKTGSGKVKIIIKGTPQLIIEEIKIKGNYNLTDRELKLASGIGLNSLYFEDNIAKIREEIVYYYRENGYFSVRVSIATEKISPTAITARAKCHTVARSLSQIVENTRRVARSLSQIVEKTSLNGLFFVIPH